MQDFKLYYNIYLDGFKPIYHCHLMDNNGIYTGKGAFYSKDEFKQLLDSFDFSEVKRVYI